MTPVPQERELDHESNLESEFDSDESVRSDYSTDSELSGESDGSIHSSHETEKAATQPAAKRPKTSTPSRGGATLKLKTLSLLPTMPLDILFEVLRKLSPKGLLAVSRTNKLFRQTLWAPHACFLWKGARSRDGPPDCPGYLHEARWTALLYGKHCQNCGRRGARKPDFYIRLRLCMVCKQTGYLVKSKALLEFPDSEDILLLIPATNKGPFTYGFDSSSQFFWRSDIEMIKQKLYALKHQKSIQAQGAQAGLENFQKERLALISLINATAPGHVLWQTKKEEERAYEDEAVAMKREADICQKFVDLGYELAYVEEAIEENYEDDYQLIKRPKPLTERDWNIKVRPELEPLVEEAALSCQITKRINIIRDLYKAFQQSVPPREIRFLPSVSGICDFECFSQKIHLPWTEKVTEDSFTDAMLELPTLIASKKEATMQHLSRIVRESLGAEYDPSVLSLATTVFKCPTISYSYSPHMSYLFGAPDVLAHHCRGSVAVAEVDARTAVAILIKATGRNPANTTVEDMDNAGTRFTCCGGKCRASYAYDWRSAVFHHMKHLSGTTKLTKIPTISEDIWIVLSKEDAETVKQQELLTGKMRGNRWLCSHCTALGIDGAARRDVEDHLRQAHNIDVPSTPSDLFFNDDNTVPEAVALEPLKIRIPLRRLPEAARQFQYLCKHCQKHGYESVRSRRFQLEGVKSHIMAKHNILAQDLRDTDWILMPST